MTVQKIYWLFHWVPANSKKHHWCECADEKAARLRRDMLAKANPECDTWISYQSWKPEACDATS